jgi:hypothetical protein
MTRADEFHRKAEDADKEADKIAEPIVKNAYREIAKQWRLMAAYAERNAG